MLIQFGDLGVTAVGAGVILALGKKVNIKGRVLIKEAMNINSGKGIVKLVYRIFAETVIIEFIGVILNFAVFAEDYPVLDDIETSFFHSVAAFNN